MRLSGIAGLFCVAAALAACTGLERSVALPTLHPLALATATSAPSATPAPTVTAIPLRVGVPSPAPPPGRVDGRIMGNLVFNEPVPGILSEGDPLHVYTLVAEPGDVVNIRVSPVGGDIDPHIRLNNRDGVPIAVDDDAGGGRAAELRNVALEAGGLYTLQIAGTPASGGYRLEASQGERYFPSESPGLALTPSPTLVAATPTPVVATGDLRLADHVPVKATLGRPGSFNRFTFAAEAGQAISVLLQPESTAFLPSLAIYDPLGQLVTTVPPATPAGSALRVDPLTVQETGIYAIFVQSEDNSIGPYRLAYGVGNTTVDVYRDVLAPGQTASALLEAGTRDNWWADLAAGDRLTVAVTPTGAGELDVVVQLIAPDGSLLGTASPQAASGETPAFAVPAAGRYRIALAASDGLTPSPYQLAWRLTGRAPTATPMPDYYTLMRYDGQVADRTYGFFPFYGRAGQQVRVRVLATDGVMDPVAVLLDPAGEEIAGADDSDGTLNPAFDAVLPVDGSYNVRVNGYERGGAFTIIVEALFGP
jgi:hypothetical protein